MSAARTRCLFPHLEGGEGNRRAAISRRARRAYRHLVQLTQDLDWIAERRPDLSEALFDALDTIHRVRGDMLDAALSTAAQSPTRNP